MQGVAPVWLRTTPYSNFVIVFGPFLAHFAALTHRTRVVRHALLGPHGGSRADWCLESGAVVYLGLFRSVDVIHNAKLGQNGVEWLRFQADNDAYRSAADEVMAAAKVPVIDLFGFTSGLGPSSDLYVGLGVLTVALPISTPSPVPFKGSRDLRGSATC